jgi:hypothetical protein
LAALLVFLVALVALAGILTVFIRPLANEGPQFIDRVPQGLGNVAIRPHLSDAPRRCPAPRDRVGPGGSQTPATGMFGRLVADRDLAGSLVRQADPNCRASAVDPSALSAREPPRSCDGMKG